jgi:hypothetical protein
MKQLGCRFDTGRHRRPSAISRWHGLEFTEPRRPRLHDEQRDLRGAARRDQSQQHTARQLQRHRQRQPVHRCRRHAHAAVLNARYELDL